jgi:hypothetical protein
MNRNTGSIYQIISDIKSISSEKRNASEQVAKVPVPVPSFCLVIKIMCQQSNHVPLGGKALRPHTATCNWGLVEFRGFPEVTSVTGVLYGVVYNMTYSNKHFFLAFVRQLRGV